MQQRLRTAPLTQPCHGLRELHLVIELREANHVPAAATAVAVEEIFVGIHQETRFVIFMQRTEPHPSAAAEWPHRAPIFEHTIANPDFRAEGTRNENGILGYGRRGMRVYDFGWQQAERGWGFGGEATMRLQMHATDPELLEIRLGTIQSKGCIRIPATLNTFIDRHAILDADYEQATAPGQTFWVLSKTREPTPWSGRYLVIVDTESTSRPPWSPLRRKR